MQAAELCIHNTFTIVLAFLFEINMDKKNAIVYRKSAFVKFVTNQTIDFINKDTD